MSLSVKTIRTFLKNRNGRILSLFLSFLDFNVFVLYTLLRTLSLFFEDPELLKFAFESIQGFYKKLEGIPASVWIVLIMLFISFVFIFHLVISYLRLHLKTSLIYSYLIDLSKRKTRLKKITDYAKTRMSKILSIDIIFLIPSLLITLCFVGFCIWNFSTIQENSFIVRGEDVEVSHEFSNKLLFFYIALLVYIVVLWLYKNLSAISQNFSYVFALMSRRTVAKSIFTAISLHTKKLGSSLQGRFGLQILIWIVNGLVFLITWLINKYIIQTSLNQVVDTDNTLLLIAYIILGLFFVVFLNIASSVIKSLKLSYMRELFIVFYAPSS